MTARPWPYAVVQEGQYFYCVDQRTGNKASYPHNSRRAAGTSAATLNNAYRMAIAELVA